MTEELIQAQKELIEYLEGTEYDYEKYKKLTTRISELESEYSKEQR